MLKKSFMTIGIVAAIAGAFFIGKPAKSAIKAGDITGGVVAPHVNIAAFHKLHGKEGFTYPEHIADDDIITALSGSAQYIFLNHTSGLKDGDVISLANDVLRDNSGSFEDFGVDCQFSVHLEGASGKEDVVMGGMCEVLMVDKDHRQLEHKLLIKPTKLQDGKGWVLLYNDAEDGIAIYADEEIGLE